MVVRFLRNLEAGVRFRDFFEAVSKLEDASEAEVDVAEGRCHKKMKSSLVKKLKKKLKKRAKRKQRPPPVV